MLNRGRPRLGEGKLGLPGSEEWSLDSRRERNGCLSVEKVQSYSMPCVRARESCV